MLSSGLRVEDEQVGQLARFERADVLVHADVVRAVERRGAERLQRRHAALHEHPQLPVRAEALALAVRAELHADAGVVELLAPSVALLKWLHSSSGAIVRRRDRESMTRARHEASAGACPPRRSSSRTSSSRPTGRRSRRSASACSRLCVFDQSCIDVVVDASPPGCECSTPVWPSTTMVMLCSNSEPPSGTTIISSLARGLDDLLALIAARLVVALHAERADRLHAAQVRAARRRGCRCRP